MKKTVREIIERDLLNPGYSDGCTFALWEGVPVASFSVQDDGFVAAYDIDENYIDYDAPEQITLDTELQLVMVVDWVINE